MNVMNGWKLQCATTTCLPFCSVSAPTLLQCQIKCLPEVQCKVASFQQSISMCLLFANTVDQNRTLEADSDTCTMMVIFGVQVPL
ncbi:unnamed protein product, partial [Adineta steineri]